MQGFHVSVVNNIMVASGFMGSLGLALAAVLVVANRRLFVFEDPRIDQVEELLPRSNCGACGEAGCRTFAEKLIAGTIEPGQCTVNTGDMNKTIAGFLGVAVGAQEQRVARLACGGGKHVARIRASYQGMSSCRAAALVSGGGKYCAWGCLGMGDCEQVCDFDALRLDQYGLPIIDAAKCSACGDCVDICPKGLLEIHPISHKLWVACKNLEMNDRLEEECEVACTACARCAADSPEGLIEIRDNLALIDYAKNDLASRVAIQRCPTGAIVWLDDNQGPVKGRDAKKVIRKEALPIG